MNKRIFVALALGVSFARRWYAHRSGRMPDSGSILGWEYPSVLVGATVRTLKFL